MLHNPQLDVTIMLKSKTEKNFRQIIKLEKIDFCNVMKNVNMFLAFKSITYAANLIFPGLVHNCPYQGVSKKTNIFDINKENVVL